MVYEQLFSLFLFSFFFPIRLGGAITWLYSPDFHNNSTMNDILGACERAIIRDAKKHHDGCLLGFSYKYSCSLCEKWMR